MAGEREPEWAKVKVVKSCPGVAWAGLSWQYLENLGKVTSHEGSELKLGKQLFVRRNTDQGEVLDPVKGALEPGDELVTRLVLRNDRAIEFVQLKDQRGNGTGPVNRLSVRVQHRGRYQTGVAEIRCLYVPESAAHSASLPVEVK